jgi:hypothetical protein
MTDSINAILLGLVFLETTMLFSIWINGRVSHGEPKKTNKILKTIALIVLFFGGIAVLLVYSVFVAEHIYPDKIIDFDMAVFAGVVSGCIILFYQTAFPNRNE